MDQVKKEERGSFFGAKTAKKLTKSFFDWLSFDSKGFDQKKFRSDIFKKIYSEPISNYLLCQTYNPDTGLFKTEVGTGFLFSSDPLFTVYKNTAMDLNEIFQNILPVGSMGQILLSASSDISDFLKISEKTRSNHSIPMLSKISQKRNAFFKRGSKKNLISRDYRLRNFDLFFSFVIPNSLGFNENDILNLKERVFSNLSRAGLPVFEMGPSSLINITKSLLCPRKLDDLETSYWKPESLISQQMVEPNFLRKLMSTKIANAVNDLEQYSFQAIDYPIEPIFLEQMATAIGHVKGGAFINCPFTMSVTFEVLNSDEELLTAELRSNLADGRAFERQGKSELALRDAHLWREMISCKEKQERLIATNFRIGITCAAKDLAANSASLYSIFGSNLGIKISKLDFFHMPSLLFHLPLNQSPLSFKNFASLGLINKMWSKNLVNTLPILAEDKGLNSGIMFAGRRGQVCFWDPFKNDRGNYNVAVVGGSGAGKSVFIQEAVVSMLSQGGRAWIVDVGRSYAKLSRVLAGRFVEFSSNSNLCLNPFSMVNESTLDNFFQFMVAFVYSMAFPGDAPYQFEGWCKAIIMKSVQKVWFASKENNTIASIQDLIDELFLIDDPRVRDLAIQLEPFGINGYYGSFFNGVGNLDFDDDFIVFELEEINGDKHLQKLIFLMLLHYITEKMYLSDRSRKMSLVIDEAWDMLKGGNGADIIESIARRARKYNGNLWTGTQGLADYDSSPAAKAAWENSYWQCLMSQDHASINKAQQAGLIELGVEEESLLKTVSTIHGQFSELMIRGKSGGYMLVRLLLDNFSKALYSTQAKEYRYMQQLESSGLTTIEAIEKISEDCYESI